MKNVHVVSALVVSLALGGCMSLDPVELANGYADDFDANAQAMSDLGSGTPDTLPSGKATYDGAARLAASTDGFVSTMSVFVGDVSLTADFDNSSLAGKASDFVGVANVDPADYADFSDVADVAKVASGTVSVAGDIGHDASIDASYSGSVSLDGSKLTVGGDGSGHFRGSDAPYLRIDGDTDDALTLDVDGDAAGGVFYINAKKK